MRSVHVAELQNRLSKYLTFVKGGEEVAIRDRNLPAGRLVPFLAEGAEDQELGLVAAGKLSLKVRLGVNETPEDSVGKGYRKQGDASRSRRPRRRSVKNRLRFVRSL